MAYTPSTSLSDAELDQQTTVVETMQLMLLELRIMNHYLYTLPTQLNSGYDQPSSDEPGAFRNDPSAFN